MASVETIKASFLANLTACFRPPYGVEEDRLLQQFVDALRPFDAMDLAAGWLRVRDGWDKTTMPPIAFCVKACAEAKQARTGEAQEAGNVVYPWSERDRAVDAWLRTFEQTGLAGRAKREGWFDGLRGYARQIAYRAIRDGRSPEVTVSDEQIRYWTTGVVRKEGRHV